MMVRYALSAAKHGHDGRGSPRAAIFPLEASQLRSGYAVGPDHQGLAAGRHTAGTRFSPHACGRGRRLRNRCARASGAQRLRTMNRPDLAADLPVGVVRSKEAARIARMPSCGVAAPSLISLPCGLYGAPRGPWRAARAAVTVRGPVRWRDPGPVGQQEVTRIPSWPAGRTDARSRWDGAGHRGPPARLYQQGGPVMLGKSTALR